jgi:1,2-dihydroxy-3-keto-5-methylthiopentene dioxygenase
MAVLWLHDAQTRIGEHGEIRDHLASVGIDYERWAGLPSVGPASPPEAILEAYSREIAELKARGGYVTADVIDVTPQTPGLGEMLGKFNREHWHDEDEVRFILEGRGVFEIHPKSGGVVGIEVGPGDLIRVPRGTWHWFDLCPERRIRAIRLFQDPSGWTPHYTGSGIDARYEPVCFGPAYVPPA